MNNRWKLPAALILAVASGLWSPTFGQSERKPSPAEQKRLEQYLQEKNRRNFSGWTGISFHCSPSNAQREATERVCEHVAASAKFLAATAGVKFTVATSAEQAEFISGISPELTLMVGLLATKATTPAAMSANVRAYSTYYRATQSGSLPTDKGPDPRAAERSGDLVFWERVIIGASSGTAQSQVAELSQSIDTQLKEFFADFVAARNKPAPPTR